MTPTVQGPESPLDVQDGTGSAGSVLSDTTIEDRGETLDVSVLRAAIAMQHELAAVGLDLKAVMQRIADSTRDEPDCTGR